ncbi:hypothetical protein F4Y59_06365 [Candidatus Poribacteria bacterium]|nr:hypothetical protein [Candidatus Poribacteria bacterium]
MLEVPASAGTTGAPGPSPLPALSRVAPSWEKPRSAHQLTDPGSGAGVGVGVQVGCGVGVGSGVGDGVAVATGSGVDVGAAVGSAGGAVGCPDGSSSV